MEERRRYKRVLVNFHGEIIVGTEHFQAEIQDISEYCAAIRTPFSKSPVHFPPGSIVNLKFQLPSGSSLHLICEVKWSSSNKTSSGEYSSSMGVELIDPPKSFKDFVKSNA